MFFIALVKFKKKLSKEIIAENLKDIEADTNRQVRYLGIYWTLGRYDTVVLFEAPTGPDKTWATCVVRRDGISHCGTGESAGYALLDAYISALKGCRGDEICPWLP